MSVTYADLNNACSQWGCNLVTHCSFFVLLYLGKTHLFSGVEGSTQSMTEAKGEGLGACQLRLPTWWRNNHYFLLLIQFLSATVLLQVTVQMTIWHWTKICKRFKLCFDMIIYLKPVERHWQFHGTQTCTHEAICWCNPFEQLVRMHLLLSKQWHLWCCWLI